MIALEESEDFCKSSVGLDSPLLEAASCSCKFVNIDVIDVRLGNISEGLMEHPGAFKAPVRYMAWIADLPGMFMQTPPG